MRVFVVRCCGPVAGVVRCSAATPEGRRQLRRSQRVPFNHRSRLPRSPCSWPDAHRAGCSTSPERISNDPPTAAGVRSISHRARTNSDTDHRRVAAAPGSQEKRCWVPGTRLRPYWCRWASPSCASRSTTGRLIAARPRRHHQQAPSGAGLATRQTGRQVDLLSVPGQY